jgi:hypothetical protein
MKLALIGNKVTRGCACVAVSGLGADCSVWPPGYAHPDVVIQLALSSIPGLPFILYRRLRMGYGESEYD